MIKHRGFRPNDINGHNDMMSVDGLHIELRCICRMKKGVRSLVESCSESEASLDSGRCQAPSFAVKSFMIPGMSMLWGHTSAHFPQPMQDEGCLSCGTAASAIGAMNPPPVNTCSL